MKAVNYFKNIFTHIKTHLSDVWTGLQEIQRRGLGPKS